LLSYRGGSMHIFDESKRFCSGNAIVGGACRSRQAWECGKFMGRDGIAVCFGEARWPKASSTNR
jgi:TPP-dependent pyruvate/acetoin dehydrogenase alpha subunit